MDSIGIDETSIFFDNFLTCFNITEIDAESLIFDSSFNLNETELSVLEDLEINPPQPQQVYEDISEDETSSTNSSESQLNIENYPIDIKDWDNTHIMRWILDLYDKEDYRYEDLNIHFFRDKTGSCLKDLEETFWNKIDTRRGRWLFEQVQTLIRYSENNLLCDRSFPTDIKYVFNSSKISDETIQDYVPRKRGRPRSSNSKPRNKEKVGRIWEFLRDLLKDTEYCPKYIRWENFDKLEFRLADPQQISHIWGRKKDKTITYEHFSRSIRHYYNLNKDDPHSSKAKIQSVPDKRLVYKFNRDALTNEDFQQFVKYRDCI